MHPYLLLRSHDYYLRRNRNAYLWNLVRVTFQFDLSIFKPHVYTAIIKTSRSRFFTVYTISKRVTRDRYTD